MKKKYVVGCPSTITLTYIHEVNFHTISIKNLFNTQQFVQFWYILRENAYECTAISYLTYFPSTYLTKRCWFLADPAHCKMSLIFMILLLNTNTRKCRITYCFEYMWKCDIVWRFHISDCITQITYFLEILSLCFFK